MSTIPAENRHPVTMPEGMVSVSADAFFAKLNADPRNIMPSHTHPDYTTWETPSREVWGWSAPGWKNPCLPKLYAVTKKA